MCGSGLRVVVSAGWLGVVCLAAGVHLSGQQAAAQSGDDASEAAKQQEVQQFHTILRDEPEPGYLFDRFYNTWLDYGTLEELEGYLQEQVEGEGGTADQLLLAFFYLKQGEPVETVQTLERAVAEAPDHASARYHLARLRMQTLDFEGAVEDIEAAYAAEADAELALEIGKLRGQIYARTDEPEKARQAWAELLQAHPEDEHLYEDLIDLQLEEDLHDEALETAEQLVEQTDDPYQRVVRQLRIGDIHSRAGRQEEALQVYGGTLADVGSDGWLEREIYAQIEQVFRREDDITGLQSFYGDLLEEHDQRVTLRLRQAEILEELGDDEQALEQWRQVLELTPGEREYREGYVDALAAFGEHAEAIERQQELVEQHPDDGELKIRLAELQHEADDAEAAAETLTEYLEGSDGSLFAYMRTTRLLERFDAEDRAVAVYEQMREAHADDAAAARVQAEFLHRIDRTDEAVAVWRSLAAEGNLEELLNVASALSGRSEHEAAFEVLRDRLEEFEDEPRFLAAISEQAMRLEQYEQALPWARRRLGMAEDQRAFESALSDAVRIAERTDRVRQIVAELEEVAELDAGQVCLLAELLEGEGRGGEANRRLAAAAAQAEAAEDAEGLKRVLHQRVRLARHRRNWAEAAETLERLINLPGGRNVSNVQQLVEILERGGLLEKALTWTEQWRELTPTSTTPWVREADLHAAARDPEAAVQTLRRAVRRFDSDHDLRARLAQVYRDQGQLGDAQRIYEQLYEETEDLSSRIGWVSEMASVADQRGRTRQLVERFERRQRSNRGSTGPLLALAEIHRTNGDYEQRRQALMRATRIEPDNASLLMSIARMEEREGDYDRALETLDRAAEAGAGDRARQRKARLHLALGEQEQGYELLYELAGGGGMDAEGLEKIADAMAGNMDWERAAEFLQEQSDRFPDDYRLTYLRGVALEESGLDAAAVEAYLAVLRADQELSRVSQTGQQQQVSGYLEELARLMPPGGQRLLQLSAQAQQVAYQRQRQMMGGGMMATAAPAVTMPADLEAAHDFALVRLYGLSQVMSDAERAPIVEAMRAAGVPAAEVLLELPWDPGPTVVNATDILEEHGDDPALASMWVMESVMGGPGGRGVVDTERGREYFELFREDWPQTAVLAAVLAASGGEEEADWFEQEAMPLLDEVEEPNYILVAGLAMSVADLRGLGAPAGANLSEQAQAKLAEHLLAWYPKLRDQQTQYGSYVFQMVSQVAVGRENLEAYVRLLDDEIRHARQQGTGASGQMAMAMRYLRQQDSLTAVPVFPPVGLLDLPMHVLTQPAVGGGAAAGMSVGGETMPDADALMAAMDEAGEPVLRVLLAYGADETEMVEREIGQMLEAEAPSLNAHVLAAAYAGDQGDAVRAIELLETARFLPMTAQQRRRLDGAMVGWAMEVSGEEEAMLAARETGRQAALRLRQAQLGSDERQQLMLALEELGLEEEADAMAELAQQAQQFLGGLTGGGQAMVTPSQPPAGQSDRLRQLAEDGDTERAVNLARRQLRQYAQVQQSGQGAMLQHDPDLGELRELLERHDLMSEVIESSRPDEEAGVRSWAHFATVCQILGEDDEAAEVYEQIVEDRPAHAQSRYQLALLRVEQDPEAAAEQLLHIGDDEWAQVGPQLMAHVQNTMQADWRVGLSHYEMVDHWLSEYAPAEAVGMEWVEAMLDSLHGRIGFGSDGGLPSLYASDEAPEGMAEQAERRERLYRRISERLLERPATATHGLHHRVALAERDGEDLDRFVGPAQAALRHRVSPRTQQQQQQMMMQAAYSYSMGEEDHTPYFRDPAAFLVYHAWQTEQPELVEQMILPAMEEGRRPQREQEEIEAYAALYLGEAEQFVEQAEAYLEGASYNANMPFQQDHSRPDAVVQAWRERRLEVEIAPLVVESVVSATTGGGWVSSVPRYFARFIDALADRGETAAVRSVLRSLADELVGPREARAELIREQHSPNNFQAGTRNAQIQSFQQMYLQGLARHANPVIALAAMEQLNGTNLGDGYYGPAVTEQLLEKLDEAGAVEADRLEALGIEPEDEAVAEHAGVIAALAGSALLEDPEHFTVYTLDAGSAEQSLLWRLPVWLRESPERAAAVRQWLGRNDAPTFGEGLLRAMLAEEDSGAQVLAYLAEREAAVDELQPFDQLVLARMVRAGDEPAGLSGPARAMYQRLVTLSDTNQQERLEEILNADRLSELGLEQYSAGRDLAEELLPLVGQLSEGDPQTAKALVEKGIDLIQQAAQRGSSFSSRGGSEAGQFVEAFREAGAASSGDNSDADAVERLRVSLTVIGVVRDRVESPVELREWYMRSVRGWLDDAMKIPGESSVDRLEAGLANLAAYVSEPVDMSFIVAALGDRLRAMDADARRQVAAWAGDAGGDNEDADEVEAVLRHEAAMMAGLLLSRDDDDEAAAAHERAVAHYRGVLNDDELSPTYRVYVARSLLEHVTEPEIALAAGRLTAEFIADRDAPVLANDLSAIVKGLLDGQPDHGDEVAEIGGEIVRRYVRQQQGSGSSTTYISSPGSIATQRGVTAPMRMLMLAIAIDDDDAIDALLRMPRGDLAGDPATWLLLVRSGRHERVVRLANRELEELPAEPVQGVTYDADAAAGVEALVGEIESSERRYFVELLLDAMPDADAEKVEADERDYPDRATRLAELAERLDELAADSALRGPALTMLSREGSSLQIIADVIAEQVEGWDLKDVLSAEQHNASTPGAMQEIERRKQMAMLHLRGQMLRGDIAPVQELLSELLEEDASGSNRDGPDAAISSLGRLLGEHLYGGALAEMTLDDLAAKADELRVFADPPNGVHFSHGTNPAPFYVLALAAADDQEGLAALEDLDQAWHTHTDFSSEQMRELIADLLLKPEPADSEQAAVFVANVLSESPLKMSEMQMDDLFEAGLLEEEALLEHGEKLTERMPADRQPAVLLAVAMLQQQHAPDEAAEAWKRAAEAARSPSQSVQVVRAMREAGQLEVEQGDGPLLSYDFTEAEADGGFVPNAGRYPLPLALRGEASLEELDGVQVLRLQGGDAYADTFLHHGLGEAWTISVWVRGDAPPAGGPPRSVVALMPIAINWDHRHEGARAVAETHANDGWRHATLGELEGERWYHLVGRLDEEGLRAYRDGELIGTNTEAGGDQSPRQNTMILGRHPRYESLNGRIAGVKVYGRALDDDEIRALHEQPPAGLADELADEE